MAMSNGTDVSNLVKPVTTSDNSFLSGLSSLVLDYGRARLIDSETKNSISNVPDRNDLIYGIQGAASADSTGGVYSKQFLGVTPAGWAVGGVLVVVSLILLKQTKVI
jgi:hypothetical protein